jgi:small subunit ribosomal protein S17
MVHDPSSSLREGDIVRIARGWRTSKHKRHIATEVVAAFGTGPRLPLPRLEDLVAEKERRREEKRKRRAARAMGLLEEDGSDPGMKIKEVKTEEVR